MELAIRIVTAVIALAGIILTIIQSVRVYRAKKAKGEDADLLDIILSNLLPSMETAEQSGMTGSAKKMYVKSCVMLACQSLGITYSDEIIDQTIERFIKFSKTVNASPEKEETTEVATSASAVQNLGYGQVK